jgi:hypothetical protein
MEPFCQHYDVKTPVIGFNVVMLTKWLQKCPVNGLLKGVFNETFSHYPEVPEANLKKVF